MTLMMELKQQRREGREEGREEGQNITLKAMQMLKEKVSIEKICQETGCTKEYISKLQALVN